MLQQVGRSESLTCLLQGLSTRIKDASRAIRLLRGYIVMLKGSERDWREGNHGYTRDLEAVIESAASAAALIMASKSPLQNDQDCSNSTDM